MAYAGRGPNMISMRKITHATPQKRAKPKKQVAAKPTVIVTAKSREQIDKNRRIALLRERGY